MFTSYRIDFRSVSQFSYYICVEYEFKTLSIISMCFDGQNIHLKKRTREKTVILTTKKSRVYQKFISFGQMMQ